jgi:aminoglycoside N3'-acetyltransferase
VAAPNTRTSLAADLRALGLQAGMAVMVHSALGRVGGADSLLFSTRALVDFAAGGFADALGR